MPTNEWFQENPKISAYISRDLHGRLETWMEAKGIKKISQALTQILEEHLEIVQSSSNQSTSVESRLDALEGKVESILRSMTELKREAYRSSRPKVDQSRESGDLDSVIPASLTSGKELLTTGEAYEAIRARGFSKSKNTFRRLLHDGLENGSLSEELSQHGLIADFETRRAANPKDNRVRWLFFS